jgi:hypothetical protein
MYAIGKLKPATPLGSGTKPGLAEILVVEIQLLKK